MIRTRCRPGPRLPDSARSRSTERSPATSIGGTIVINTPATIKQCDIDPFPRQGRIQVHGVNNGLLVLSVLSTSTLEVKLDADGDGTVEFTKS
ncbi:MAG TPA: hypothetical protein VMG60_10190 [Burkholderiaceae bacterium]|nr:hypothetical protein [Burkholderiaceae bacterium]